MDSERLVGDHRCWPCTAANSAIGLVIAWLPPAAMLLAGNRGALPAAAAWGVVITAYSTYRLVRRGASRWPNGSRRGRASTTDSGRRPGPVRTTDRPPEKPSERGTTARNPSDRRSIPT